MNDSVVKRLGAELAFTFFKLGVIGFGGPAAHIAMMQDEVVDRKQWLTREHFLDLVGATNLIPGPNSTEMAIHVGYVRAGWLGLVIAGVCFICPAVLLTAAFAWVYVQFGKLPTIAPLLYGIKPAVLAVIFGAVWKLGKTALKKNNKLLVIGIGVAVAVFCGVSEIFALLLGGLLGMIWLKRSQSVNALLLPLSLATAVTKATAANLSLLQLGLFFLKIGCVLYGGGYVLVAFLQGELVDDLGWLTQQQLLDAIAIGQFTPGPVLSTATFIGYVIAGFPGAVVATMGIFLPSFVFVALLNPLIPRLRNSQWMSAFLDAVNISSVALMVVVTVELARAIIIPIGLFDWIAALIAIGSAISLVRYRINAAWIVLGSAVIGWILKGFVS